MNRELTPELENRLRTLLESYETKDVECEETDEEFVKRQHFLEGWMCGLTEGLDEHPDWWEHPCFCNSCRSY